MRGHYYLFLLLFIFLTYRQNAYSQVYLDYNSFSLKSGNYQDIKTLGLASDLGDGDAYSVCKALWGETFLTDIKQKNFKTGGKFPERFTTLSAKFQLALDNAGPNQTEYGNFKTSQLESKVRSEIGDLTATNQDEIAENLAKTYVVYLYGIYMIRGLSLLNIMQECMAIATMTSEQIDAVKGASYEPQAMGMMMMMGGMGGMGGMGMMPGSMGMATPGMTGGMGTTGGVGMMPGAMGGMAGGFNPMMMMMMGGQVKCSSNGTQTQDYDQCKKIVQAFDMSMMAQMANKTQETATMSQSQISAQRKILEANGKDPTVQLQVMKDQMDGQANIAFVRAALDTFNTATFLALFTSMPTTDTIKKRCQQNYPSESIGITEYEKYIGVIQSALVPFNQANSAKIATIKQQFSKSVLQPEMTATTEAAAAKTKADAEKADLENAKKKNEKEYDECVKKAESLNGEEYQKLLDTCLKIRNRPLHTKVNYPKSFWDFFMANAYAAVDVSLAIFPELIKGKTSVELSEMFKSIKEQNTITQPKTKYCEEAFDPSFIPNKGVRDFAKMMTIQNASMVAADSMKGSLANNQSAEIQALIDKMRAKKDTSGDTRVKGEDAFVEECKLNPQAPGCGPAAAGADSVYFAGAGDLSVEGSGQVTTGLGKAESEAAKEAARKGSANPNKVGAGLGSTMAPGKGGGSGGFDSNPGGPAKVKTGGPAGGGGGGGGSMGGAGMGGAPSGGGGAAGGGANQGGSGPGESGLKFNKSAMAGGAYNNAGGGNKKGTGATDKNPFEGMFPGQNKDGTGARKPMVGQQDGILDNPSVEIFGRLTEAYQRNANNLIKYEAVERKEGP